MKQFPEEFDSIFRYIEVVSQRAEQLIKGARPRSESRATKLTLQARDDVDEGLVSWRILTQEELDARRQEMAEQFRAEMAGEATPEAEHGAPVDVLPTGTEPVVEKVAAAESQDEELDRLQRLLGMIGGQVPDIVENADESDDAEAETATPEVAEGSGEEVNEED